MYRRFVIKVRGVIAQDFLARARRPRTRRKSWNFYQNFARARNAHAYAQIFLIARASRARNDFIHIVHIFTAFESIHYRKPTHHILP